MKIVNNTEEDRSRAIVEEAEFKAMEDRREWFFHNFNMNQIEMDAAIADMQMYGGAMIMMTVKGEGVSRHIPFNQWTDSEYHDMLVDNPEAGLD